MTTDVKIKNRIKEVAKSRGVGNQLIALKCNVHYTTVSQWFSNRQQPSIENTIKILELLEVDFTDIVIYEKHSINTGLGKVLEKKLKSLLNKDELPLQITQVNTKTKKKEKVYNPVIIEELKKIEKEHKSK